MKCLVLTVSLFPAILGASELTSPQGVQNNSSQFESYKKECDSGELRACGVLGQLYLSGLKGAPKDPVRAAELFRRNCDQRLFSSCAYLGTCYERGEGVPKDLAAALRLYRRACDADDRGVGCSDLEFLCEKQNGFAEDQCRPNEQDRRACEERGERCSLLALQLKTGSGLEKDLVAAARLYRRACGANSQWACEAAKKLEPTSGQLPPMAPARTLPASWLVQADQVWVIDWGESGAELADKAKQLAPKIAKQLAALRGANTSVDDIKREAAAMSAEEWATGQAAKGCVSAKEAPENVKRFALAARLDAHRFVLLSGQRAEVDKLCSVLMSSPEWKLLVSRLRRIVTNSEVPLMEPSKQGR
jgi:TPR repeat protein